MADFSRVLAGPFATMTLADLGATVVKVEQPCTGDETRHWGPPWSAAGHSSYNERVNRTKRSIALNLNVTADAIIAQDLVRRADFLVQNFLSGVMARFGLDVQSFHINPQLEVILSSTAPTDSHRAMPWVARQRARIDSTPAAASVVLQCHRRMCGTHSSNWAMARRDSSTSSLPRRSATR